jgi:hypothetical protein
MTDDFVLRINEEGSPSNFIELDGKFDNETLNRDGSGGPDEVANSSIRKRRYFAASLPAANYVFRFIRGGKMDWPTSVEVTFEKPQCDTALTNERVSIGEPSPSVSSCNELIKNGDMEMSTTDYLYWLHQESGLSLASGKGISGSTALAEIDPRAPENGLVGQFLDTRCLRKGKQYEVQAWVKVLRNGAPYDCDPMNNCPTTGLKTRIAQDEDGLLFSESNIDVVNYFEDLMTRVVGTCYEEPSLLTSELSPLRVFSCLWNEEDVASQCLLTMSLSLLFQGHVTSWCSTAVSRAIQGFGRSATLLPH